MMRKMGVSDCPTQTLSSSRQSILFFAGVVVMTQRDLITYLLNTEADWPWHEQQQLRPLNASIPSKG